MVLPAEFHYKVERKQELKEQKDRCVKPVLSEKELQYKTNRSIL